MTDARLFPIKDGLIFIEALPLGLRGKGFLGAAHYAADNPPVGAVFTYYVKDEVKSLQDKRRELEKEKIKKGEEIRYPTYAELQAEATEEAPYLLFTIRDAGDAVVRKLKASASKGVQCITWDGRRPSLSPIRESSNPNEDSGMLAVPGEYTVSLSKSVNGQFTELVGPQPFLLESLGGVTLAARDRQALAQFHREAGELDRVIDGASRRLREVDDRLKLIEKAIAASSAPTEEMISLASEVREELRAIRLIMDGDDVASQLDQDPPMGVASRMGWLVYEMWRSTSAPTETQKEALRIIRKEFSPLPARINELADGKLKALEEALEKAGAPYTPGRRIELGRG